MKKCRICNGNCDNGELTGGVCPECREEERIRQMAADKIVKAMNSPCYQMELEVV